jgi:hypothetical protein
MSPGAFAIGFMWLLELLLSAPSTSSGFLNGICLLLSAQGLKFSPDDFLSGDASRTRQTLGMIERQLRNTRIFDPHFSERLQVFTRRRNRIVHGLYADSFHSHDEIDIDSPVAQEYVKECDGSCRKRHAWLKSALESIACLETYSNQTIQSTPKLSLSSEDSTNFTNAASAQLRPN